MDFNKPIWIGSTTDVRIGEDAKKELLITSDIKYWDDENGIVKVDMGRWQIAQKYEHDCWMLNNRHASSDRNNEHKTNFNNYDYAPQHLGNMIEIGCGPFTQANTILSCNKTCDKITLLDPLIKSYLNLANCTYRNGKLASYDVEMIDIPAEQLARHAEYDTAVCINVLEHVMDAGLVLENLYNCIKPGGTIIFHDKAWDHINVSMLYDAGHPIRMKRKFIDGFLKRFESLFINNDYFIGQKTCLEPTND